LLAIFIAIVQAYQFTHNVFWFSVGDFTAAASLAAKLAQALSKTKGASAEYQALVQDLDGVRQTFSSIGTDAGDKSPRTVYY
jgi:hypothetical protein